jgi:hypothetical protein
MSPAPRAADGCLYEDDAIDIGILLFGEQICAACGEPLPKCADYYAPDKRNPSGLVYECRRCRRALERERWARRREREVTSSGQLSLAAQES